MRHLQTKIIPGRVFAIALTYLLLLSVIALTLSLYFSFSGWYNYSSIAHQIDNNTTTNNPDDNNEKGYPCQQINLAAVCGGFNSTKSLYILLKSILFYRTDIIKLHLFVDSVSRLIFEELFKTWIVPDLHVKFYNLTEYEHNVAWITNLHYSRQYGLMKLAALDALLSLRDISRVILLDSDMLVIGNINVIWRKFSDLKRANAALGLVENQSDWYLNNGKLTDYRRVWPALGRGFNTGLILADLNALSERNWTQVWRKVAEIELAAQLSTTLADQDVVNSIIRWDSSILFKLPCQFNIQLNDHAILDESCNLGSYDLQIVHWNSPRKLATRNARADFYLNWYLTFKNWDAKLLEQSRCSWSSLVSVTDGDRESNLVNICRELRPNLNDRLRTYLYFQDFEFEPNNLDITLVVHLSLDRFQTLDELALHWRGPISAAIYLSELETQLLQSSIEMSSNLAQRKNVGYHLVFRDHGFNYPINRLRNIALNSALTPFVFMTDVDFLPSFNLYDYLNKIIIEMLANEQTNETLSKKWVLVVPAFESLQYKFNFPTTKADLLTQLSLGSISIFRDQIWPAGHSPTDYTRWRVSSKPYKVNWRPEYEPFVVSSKQVPRFDERFVGFGWNKVEEIMKLAALKYEFWVLPEAFIIHKIHSSSFDIMQHRQSVKYRSCIKHLKRTFLSELKREFPDFFNSHSASNSK